MHVAAVLANLLRWIPFPRPTTTVTLVAIALPEITLRRSSRTTRRARATRRHRLRISGFHGRVQQAQACLCRYVGPGATTREGRDCPGASHTGGTAGREASHRGCRDGREAKGKLCRLLHTDGPKVKKTRQTCTELLYCAELLYDECIVLRSFALYCRALYYILLPGMVRFRRCIPTTSSLRVPEEPRPISKFRVFVIFWVHAAPGSSHRFFIREEPGEPRAMCCQCQLCVPTIAHL